VKLPGEDEDLSVTEILGLCDKAAEAAGWDADRRVEFFWDARGSYGHMIKVVGEHFEILYE